MNTTDKTLDYFDGPEYTDPVAVRKAAAQVVQEDPERLGAGAAATLSRQSKGKTSRARGHDLANRAVDYYLKQGFLAFRVDYTMGGGYAPLVTVDMLGFADVMAFKNGRLILVQVTGSPDPKDLQALRRAHERKLCDDTKKVPRILRSPYDLACTALRLGAEIQMVLFYKDGARWAEPEVVDVTLEWLLDRKAGLDRRRGV